MATLILKSAPGPDRVIQLRLGVNRFGRSPECDCLIEHPTVSAFHCEVELGDSGVLVRDCDSTNGTFINGEPIQKARLNRGATLQLGDVELFVESTDVQIVIPEIPRPKAPPKRTVLAVKERTGFCPQHPNNVAEYQCLACELVMCEECVRHVQRRGKTVRLCPKCDARVESLTSEPEEEESLFARLAKTIKLPFARRKPGKDA